MQNRRLDPTVQTKPGETSESMVTGPGLDSQEAVGQDVGQFWNRTESFFRSKPGPLAGFPDLLLTLGVPGVGSYVNDESQLVKIGH